MDYLPFLLFAVGCLFFVLCLVVIALGKTIGNMKTPQSGGAPTLSKPEYATVAISIVIMGLFVVGSLLLTFMMDDTFWMVIGITTIVASGLTLITSVLFCGAVIRAIQIKKVS